MHKRNNRIKDPHGKSKSCYQQTHTYIIMQSKKAYSSKMHVKSLKAITYQITRSTYSILHLHHSRAYTCPTLEQQSPIFPNIFKQSIGPRIFHCKWNFRAGRPQNWATNLQKHAIKRINRISGIVIAYLSCR